MQNNFQLVESLLNYENSFDFYFVQIMKRRKDAGNEDMKQGVKIVKDFYLYNPTDLMDLQNKIIELCTANNARATIRLNKRNAELCGLQTIAKITELVINKDFHAIPNAYASVCGSHSAAKNDKTWIVDIDSNEMQNLKEIQNFIRTLQSEIKGNQHEIKALIPSKSGVHIISNPFNLDKFRKTYPKIDVHKDAPTNLFIP